MRRAGALGPARRADKQTPAEYVAVTTEPAFFARSASTTAPAPIARASLAREG